MPTHTEVIIRVLVRGDELPPTTLQRAAAAAEKALAEERPYLALCSGSVRQQPVIGLD